MTDVSKQFPSKSPIYNIYVERFFYDVEQVMNSPEYKQLVEDIKARDGEE